MKTVNIISLIFSLVVLGSWAAKKAPDYREARLSGALAKMEILVNDNDGIPVPNAAVRVFWGMNFRVDGKWIEGLTDTNGIFVAHGKTCGDEIEVHVSKNGYYDSRLNLSYATMGAEHEVFEGKWQPYGSRRRIILRNIRNPIDMPHEDFLKFNYTKSINKWIGYDIKENDYVAPYGKGKESDFEVYIDWNGEWLPRYSGMVVKIRFTEPFSGYCPCDINAESDFKGPYDALVASDFLTSAEFSDSVQTGGEHKGISFNRLKCWVVRSRCKVSPGGMLSSANYSMISDIAFTCKNGGYGGFCVTGVFNPTPNDTNLEPKIDHAR